MRTLRVHADRSIRLTPSPDWDGKGRDGNKPDFAQFNLEQSTITGLTFVNCPAGCIHVGSSDNVILKGITIDNSAAGKPGIARNTYVTTRTPLALH